MCPRGFGFGNWLYPRSGPFALALAERGLDEPFLSEKFNISSKPFSFVDT
jgi:hypothetical protein